MSNLNSASQEVQLAAVNNYGDAIEYIKNPVTEVQLIAIHWDIHLIGDKYV